MSCIAYVCKYLFENICLNSASNFENEYFINVRNVGRVLSQFKRMIPFFYERIYKKEVSNDYIFHYWDLCE